VCPRTRIVAFGSATLLVVAGIATLALTSGVAGEAVATGLIAFGLIGIVSLIFLEVGLSEDRERARQRAPVTRLPPRPRRPWPRRPR
jgi:hypothetical protein